ncbi:hypothetical protein N7466_003106 [Penicillium verhagenii]|uniref:uncharacterized protein n=1 Tax=Penicillium verhagenii TaxID=1562060 RepID=UPI002544E683|nr:uncharacterized protein N7466_003106 [Penicillium verhagenii]KAJ5936656.1 hypothetical protein N7466_003106 [Penicillium verhagenii]
MHFTKPLKTLLAILPFTSTVLAKESSPSLPSTPELSFLYTAYVICAPSVYEFQTPAGIQAAIPIIGGNFTGPRLKGKILDLGADWGTADPQTGIFSANTRYNLQTHDGAYLYLQTSGAEQPDGNLHLRINIATGSKEYYWLNNVVAFGILQNVGDTAEGVSTLRIDAWHMANEWNSTTFVNGTTYP